MHTLPPQVLTAMEHSALESPCYLPVGVTKDGAVTGFAGSVLVNAAQMGKARCPPPSR